LVPGGKANYTSVDEPKVEKVEEKHPTLVAGKPEILQWNNREFHIRDLIHNKFSKILKDKNETQELPKIIEVDGKASMIEWNNEKHHIRDLMNEKFKKMVFHKSIGCQTDDILEEIDDSTC
jgi:hypothetical protein